jgi:monofunctional biosynthetic peptidoglycan transglycosylase
VARRQATDGAGDGSTQNRAAGVEDRGLTVLRWGLRLLLLALAVLVVIQLWFAAHVAYWVKFNPGSTAFTRARLEVMRAKDANAQLRYQWTPYERISPHLKRALIAAEDARFLEHGGFDWDGIKQAWERNRRERAIVAGGSTITQQLAKNLFFSGKRTWWRKGQEAVVTVMLEAMMSKQRILEIYLNVIEWGDGVFGAEAAARYHYGTTAASLSAQQASRLAAMTPSPRRYGPGSNTAYLRQRTAMIYARSRGTQTP